MMKRSFLFLTAIILLTACNEEQPEKKTFIAGNQVKTIYVDEHGIKWFGTESGISSFNDSIWNNYTYEDGLPDNEVIDIDLRNVDDDPQLILATNNGIGLVRKELNIAHSIVTINKANSGIRSNEIITLMQDHIGGTWVGTMEGLTVYYNNKWILSEDDEIIKEYAITDIAPGTDTIAFVCFNGQGIALMDLGAGSLTTVAWYESPTSPLPSMNIQTIYVDGDDNQWIGTDNGLAFHGSLDPETDWVVYDESDGLIDNNVLAVILDRNGIAWIGTTSGVSRFDGQDWTSYTTGDGLAGYIVFSIAIDNDNSVWLGTNDGVSHLIGDEWITYRKEP